MIDDLDLVLRGLFTRHVPGITSNLQVRFEPPNDDWRAYVKTVTIGGSLVNSLNVYLVDLRENRRYRSNDRQREYIQGAVHETPAPRRVDCHYLISAWSPADPTAAIEPTLDEHEILYQVSRALTRHDPLVPSEIFAPAAPPASLAAEVLPMMVLPPEAFPKLAEFWGTMGDKHPWRPCVYVVITVPITQPTFPSGPAVTTLIVDAHPQGVADPDDVFAAIGGVVLSGGANVAGAWVELLNASGPVVRLSLTRADAEGRFTFDFVRTGRYRLRASSASQGPSPLRVIDVPAPSGEYDLVL